ncbi:hypothetical protein BRO54_3661 [Geobacillus proteiniphilus]|uniref:Uncharacterized protein n=1 Tax=Geobacillus proteiniphilus TaxID=860353 RepID=A0A1Q5SKB6_9BACL|nr:hypothetical protein BRO54_3661 [Geobacillus proteiniphilus]
MLLEDMILKISQKLFYYVHFHKYPVFEVSASNKTRVQLLQKLVFVLQWL